MSNHTEVEHEDWIARAKNQFEAIRSKVGSSAAGARGNSDLDAASRVALPGYEVVRLVHRGGQGIVYEAVQQSTRRTVALKVLREGPFSGELDRVRFDREVGILAQLNHRSIIGILDRGESAGSHYLVMDYIDGRPLDRHAREQGLDVPERIRLFVKVCDAVSAAHQHGVIHRDLKPGNILVDAGGEPRILDFGLAKSSVETGGLEATQTGQFIGSLPWVSPEQARGLHGEVDTRSDLYSLGVVLYQLLTDRLPYSTIGELEQVLMVIRTAEPTSPRSLSAEIDDDLETIILKCLSKEPARRYQSVGELASDLRHYLAGEPIDARRDSGWYVLKKLLSRHRAAALIAASFVILVTTAGVVALALWRTASAERDRAVTARKRADTEATKSGQLAKFVQEMLSGIDPVKAGTLDKSLMRHVLEGASSRVDKELASEPEAQAAVQFTLGKSYEAIGDHEQAKTHLTKAVEIRRRILGDRHPDTLAAMDGLSMFEWEGGDLKEAEQLCRAVLKVREQTLEADHPDRLMSMAILAEIMADQGKLKEGETLARETLERRTRVLGPEHPETLSSNNNLANILMAQRRYDEAEPLFVKTVEAEKRVKGPLDPHTLRTMSNLATLSFEKGDWSGAEVRFRELLTSYQRVLGDEHPDTVLCMFNLSVVLRSKGNADEAEKVTRRVVDLGRRVLDEKNPMRATHLYSLGIILAKKNEFAQAEGFLREAVKLREALLPADDTAIHVAQLALGNCISRQGRFQEAEPLMLTHAAAVRDRMDVTPSLKAAVLQNIIAMYEAWEAAEPHTGKAEKAAQWRARLPATQPATTKPAR